MASISIRQNKNGSTAYVVRAYVCRDAKGNARYLSRTYTPKPGTSKRKVERALQELCAELDHKAKNAYILDSGQSFAQYSQHFLERKKLSCSEYTIHSYKFSLDKACEYIGHVPLEKLSSRHLDDMTLQMNRTRSQYGEPYSGAYIRHIQTMVRMVLGMAVKEGLLEVNIADSAHYSLPRANASEPDFLELNEAQQYIQAALDEPDLKIRSMVLLYLYHRSPHGGTLRPRMAGYRLFQAGDPYSKSVRLHCWRGRYYQRTEDPFRSTCDPSRSLSLCRIKGISK